MDRSEKMHMVEKSACSPHLNFVHFDIMKLILHKQLKLYILLLRPLDLFLTPEGIAGDHVFYDLLEVFFCILTLSHANFVSGSVDPASSDTTTCVNNT